MSANNGHKLRELAQPSIPSPRVLFGGTALVMSLFALSLYAVERRQLRKDAKNAAHPGAIPSWEYRMWRASHPVDNTVKTGIFHTQQPLSSPSHTRAPGGNEGEISFAQASKAVPQAPDNGGNGV